MKDFFDVEVPEPLAMFEGRPNIAPENQMVLEKQIFFRILDKQQLHKTEKMLRQVENILCDVPGFWKRLYYKWLGHDYPLRDVETPLAHRRALVEELHTARVQFHNLKRQYEICTDEQLRKELRVQGRIVKTNRKQILHELAQVDAFLKPLRPYIIRRNQLRARIDEHHRGVAQKAKDDALKAKMATEGRLWAEIFSKTLAGMGYCHEVTTRKNKKRRIMVKFERIVSTPDTVQLKVAITKMALIWGTVNLLPYGVKTSDLVEDKTIEQLSIACHRPVRCPTKEFNLWKNGLWYEVDRLGVVDGIPEQVTYKTLMGAYPAHDHHKVPLPMGVRKGRIVNFINLVDNPHFLIAGMTGSGKTNVYHAIICTVISNYSPDEIRLCFIDLKEGVAFRKYAKLPHTLGPMIENAPDAIPLLAKLEAERQRRMILIRDIAETAEEYNHLMPPEKRLPKILVMFDEYGAINGTDKLEASQIYSLTGQIAKKARAANIYLFIGAQTPYVVDVPQSVKSNLTASFVGKQKNRGASMSATGDSQAYDLPDVPGRMVAESRGSNYVVQMPLMEPDDIAKAIEHAMQYEPGADLLADVEVSEDINEFIQQAKPKPFTEADLIAWTILNNNGVISPRKLFDMLEEPVITQRQIVEMGAKLSTKKVIEFEGETYTPVPWGKGFRLQKLENSEAHMSPMEVLNEFPQVYEQYQEAKAS